MFRDLSRDTDVTPDPSVPGLFSADLPSAWSYQAPSGGVLMTVAMRAMVRALDDEALSPISATTIFASPIPAGPMTIRVETIRRGDSTAQLRARLASVEKPGPGLEVAATFGRARSGPEVLDQRMPEVPGPRDAMDLPSPEREGRPLFPIFENFEGRRAIGHEWGERGWEPSSARYARWFRYRTPQMRHDGTLDPLALPPIADTMPPALNQKLGPDHPSFHAPSLDLTIHFLQPTRSEWLLVDTRVRCALRGYASGSVDIWGEDGALVAYGTQTMFLRPRR